MTANITKRRNLRLKAGAEQRKRRADQARARARLKRAKLLKAYRAVEKKSKLETNSASQATNGEGGRERGFRDFRFDDKFEVDELELGAGAKTPSRPKPANRHERRKRRREQGGDDFLVDKDLDSNTVDAQGDEASDDSSETVPFELVDLQRLLIEDPLEKARDFAETSLRAKLVTSGSRFRDMLLNHLLTVYAVGRLILEATDTRRRALLHALGCSEDAKNIFLALLNMTLPPPELSETDERVRKLAQNRNSEYGLCLWGAKIRRVPPEQFLEELKIVGGIQAMAEVARLEKKLWQMRSDVTDQLGMFGGTGSKDDERQDDDEWVVVDPRLLPKENKSVRVKRHGALSNVKSYTSSDRLHLLRQHDDDVYTTWQLETSPRQSKQLNGLNNPFVLYCTREGDDHTLKLHAEKNLPVTLGRDPEETLDLFVRFLLEEDG